MPKLFPDPVCRLPDEYGLVAAVLAAPLDDLPKLVYADWLDERGDPRGPFLRAWLAARQAKKKLPKPDKALSKCWLGLMGYELDLFLQGQGNPAWGEAVRALALPGVVVNTIPLKDGEIVPTGGSKVGGLPDLLPDYEWPSGDEGEAAFVAQWNLAELAVSPACMKLPKQGLLSFFLDLAPYVEDSGDGIHEVRFTKNPAAVEEREPEAIIEPNELPACRVEFREWLSIPDNRSPAVERVLSDELRADYRGKHFDYPTPKGSHTILGHASPIQSYPAPSGSRKEWALLTEFGPDATARLEAADGGRWYFMVPATDLKKGKFDDVNMEFQSG